MDTRLIFRDRRIGDGGTEEMSGRTLLDWCPVHETGVGGKYPAQPLVAAVVCNGEVRASARMYVHEEPSKKNF